MSDPSGEKKKKVLGTMSCGREREGKQKRKIKGKIKN
jgi:hypothetical protein